MFQDAVWANAEHTTITMMLDHPIHGWIPITINAYEYPELWADVIAADDIGDYISNETEVVVPIPTLSFPQMLTGLVAEQWITENEGKAWLIGTPPEVVLGMIEALPAEQQFGALARVVRPTIIERNDPLVNALGQLQGKTAEELDTFFQTFSAI